MHVLFFSLGLGNHTDLAAISAGAVLLVGLAVAFFLSWLLERLEGRGDE